MMMMMMMMIVVVVVVVAATACASLLAVAPPQLLALSVEEARAGALHKMARRASVFGRARVSQLAERP